MPANTHLLLHFNGPDGSQDFRDWSYSDHPIYYYNYAQLDTDQKKFRTASLLLNGDDYLRVPSHNDWNFGLGDFTIDMWVRIRVLPGDRYVLMERWWPDYSGSYRGCWYFDIKENYPYHNLLFSFTTDGTAATQYTATSSNFICYANTWYHFTVVRQGAFIRFFVNGQPRGVGTGAYQNIFNATIAPSIGLEARTGEFGLDGWIDELRVSKGIARWTAGFTPSTVEYKPRAIWYVPHAGVIAVRSVVNARFGAIRCLRGSIAAKSTVTGHIVGVGVPLSGTNECVLIAYSQLSDQFISLKGTITIQSSVRAGAPLVPVGAYGSVVSYVTAVGIADFVLFTELVAGTTISGTSASATLTDPAVLLSGTIASKSTVSGKISGATVYCTGESSSTTIVVGKLSNATVRCTGTVTSKATVVGKLSGTKRSLSGIVMSHSTVSGALISTYTGQGWPLIPPRLLTGTVVAQCTTSAVLSTTGIEQLAGTLAANCIVSGSLESTRGVSRITICRSEVTGHLGVIRRVAGVVVAQSTVNGKLSIGGKVSLYGTITCQSTLAGFVKVSKRFVGVVTCVSVVSGTLISPKELAGTVICSSTISGRVRVTRRFTCTIVCISNTSGHLDVKGEAFLVGIIICKSTVSGNLCFSLPRFFVTQVVVLPIFAQSVTISPVLASEIAALPVFDHTVGVLPVLSSLAIGSAVFTHSVRVNERLKVLV